MRPGVDAQPTDVYPGIGAGLGSSEALVPRPVKARVELFLRVSAYFILI